MYKWSRMKVRDAFEYIVTRDARKYPYGHLISLMSLGTVSRFCWFETPDELLLFMSQKLLPGFISVTGLDSDEYHSSREIRDAVLLIRDRFHSGEISFQETEKMLCPVLAAAECEVCWWGQYSELLEGQDNFSREMRSAFRQEYLDPNDDALDEEYELPIKPGEADAFWKFIEDYEICYG